MNLSNIPQINELKDFLISESGYVQTKKIVYSWINNQCSELIKYFNDHYDISDFQGFIYLILNDQYTNIPLCPICGKHLPLRNYKVGFQKYCSQQCKQIGYSQNKDIHNKISETKKNKKLRKDTWLYDYNFEVDSSDNNYYIFKDYCKHGSLRLYYKTCNKIHEINESSFCTQCNIETFNNYKPSDIEINNFINEFPDFYKKYNRSLSYNWWITYYPKKLKILVEYFKQHTDIEFDKDNLPEIYYFCLHKLTERPKCPECGKTITRFHTSTQSYATHCDNHLYCHNSYSEQEKEFVDYIKSIYSNVEEHNRDLLKGQEADVYIPDKHIGFEFNGCYWHSNEFKDNNYHMNKKHIANDNNIDLYFIWSDDWIYKQDIVKSLIKSKLGLYDKRIYARNCVIKEVSTEEARTFIDNNHLQGYTSSKIKLGLYYNEELVSIMTFGKSRFNKDEYEIIRLCSKLNYQVIGGISKIFKYFQKHYLGNNICISYSFNDISNGNIYKQLGFIKENESESWMWLYNGIRYNRLNKIRNNKNLLKCYNSGVVKWILKNKE
jgi:endogenous inhibitor of DNA gyrase (YacG/DUF329 family)